MQLSVLHFVNFDPTLPWIALLSNWLPYSTCCDPWHNYKTWHKNTSGKSATSFLVIEGGFSNDGSFFFCSFQFCEQSCLLFGDWGRGTGVKRERKLRRWELIRAKAQRPPLMIRTLRRSFNKGFLIGWRFNLFQIFQEVSKMPFSAN